MDSEWKEFEGRPGEVTLPPGTIIVADEELAQGKQWTYKIQRASYLLVSPYNDWAWDEWYKYYVIKQRGIALDYLHHLVKNERRKLGLRLH